MRYVIDRLGVAVDGHRVAIIHGVAHAFWAELSDWGLAPRKWKGDLSLVITENYRLQMEKICKELQLCEDAWKAEQITIDYYSSWHVAQMKNGLFNIPLKQRVGEIKKEDDDKKSPTMNSPDATDGNTPLNEAPQQLRKRKSS